ncbi:MAG: isoprenylcysteine carboxylmethyltransferase family protein [Balneolaceae bacterium]
MKNKIPPLILVAIFAFLMWGISSITTSIAINESIQWVAVIFCAACGVIFCVAGILSFKRAKTTVDPLHPESASSLVTSGIYKISRNPIYVGFALLLFAWAVYLASPGSLIGVLLFVIYMDRFQIVPEERVLMKLFGDNYEQYQANVRRWL